MSAAGWRVARSIALELDAALYVALGGPPGAAAGERLSPAAAELRAAAPADWRATWHEHLGPVDTWGFELGRLALLADCLFEEDYSRATLAMRGLDAATARDRAAELAAPLGLAPDPAEPPLAATVALLRAAEGAAVGALGPSELGERELGRQLERELGRLAVLLGEGPGRGTFWHLVDQFYYETYRPWRAGRLAALDALEARARAQLGAAAGAGPPDLGWLPPQNALVAHAGLGRAVAAGRQAVVFWAEPLALFDALLVVPGLAVVTFAEPGPLLERFDARAVALAEQVKALADPTRLKMLRLIRHFDLDNTRIAGYLQVARPTVSIHARQLRAAGLITSGHEGRQARHALDEAALRQLFRDLEEFLGLPPEENAAPPG